jgi:hypothetical protein
MLRDVFLNPEDGYGTPMPLYLLISFTSFHILEILAYFPIRWQR